jgi:hypothetical protein
MPDLAKLNVAVESTGFQSVKQDLQETESHFSKAQRSIIAFNQALEAVTHVFHLVVEAGEKVIEFGEEFIHAASQSQEVVTRLNAALRATGQFSTAYSERLQQLAKDQQQMSTASDEAVISMEAQFVAFGASESQMARLTAAALDLSEALGKDTSQAAFILSKAVAGNTAMLSRLGITVDETASKSERLEQALTAVEHRFGGQAAAAADTYAGKMLRIKIAYEDVQEEIGKTIVGSAAFMSALDVVKDTISGVAADTETWRHETESTEEVIRTVIETTLGWAASIVSLTADLATFLILAQQFTDWVDTFASAGWDETFSAIGSAVSGIGAKLKPTVDEWRQANKQFDTVAGAIGFAYDGLVNIREELHRFGVAARESASDTSPLVKGLDLLNEKIKQAQEQVEKRFDFTIGLPDMRDLDTEFTSRITTMKEKIAQLKELTSHAGEVKFDTSGRRVEENIAVPAQALRAEIGRLRDESRQIWNEYERRGDIPGDKIKAMAQQAGYASAAVTKLFEKPTKDAKEAAKAMDEWRQSLADAGAQLTAQLDPAERYNEELHKIWELVNNNAISAETFDRAQAQLAQEFANTDGPVRYQQALFALEQEYRSGAISIDEFAKRQAHLDEVFGATKDGLDKLRQDIRSLVDETKTNADKLVDALRKIRDGAAAGMFHSQDEIDRATKKTIEDFEQARGAFSDTKEGVVSDSDVMIHAIQGIGDATADAIVNMAKTGKFEFKSLFEAIRDDMLRLFAHELLIDPLVKNVTEAINKVKTAGEKAAAIEKVRSEPVVRFETEPDQFQTRAEEVNQSTQQIAQSADQLKDAAPQITQSWEQMIGKVEGFFSTMVNSVTGLFGSILTSLFGSGGEGFSVGGLFKAIGIGAATSLAGSGLKTLTEPGPFGNVAAGGSSTAPGAAYTYTLGDDGTPMTSTGASAHYGANRGAGMAVHHQTFHLHMPVSVPVTTLDSSNAANVILQQMPVIEASLRKSIHRGGQFAKDVGRRL